MKSISAETKKLLIFAFLLHLQTCLLTLICAQKQGFHMDEYFTFGLALCGVPLPDSCKILHASPKDFLSGTVFLQCGWSPDPLLRHCILLQQRKRKNPFFCPRNCPLIRAALLL